MTKQLIGRIDQVKFIQIPRDQNAEPEEVARNASSDDQTRTIDWKLEKQMSPSIEEFQTFLVHTSIS